MVKTSDSNKPTVSYLGEDRMIVELLYDPARCVTALAVCRPDGAFSTEPFVALKAGDRLVPYKPTNNLIATGCVLLPSAIGSRLSTDELVLRITTFIRRYVQLSDGFAKLAPYYVLLSWVYDAFGELPYLRFRGDYGTGKTRALMTLGSICYKPFFASGASTVSPLFHVLDSFRGTMVLDEADLRFSDATAELTKILNNGNAQGLPILRTMSNRHRELNPRAFRVYGPKIIAMRESFSDQALESRFLTEETGGGDLRTDIPIHLPPCFHEEARALRNDLLAWRFAHRFSVKCDPTRIIPGVEPRLNQTALALLSIIEDPGLREELAGRLVGAQVRIHDERRASFEGVMVASLIHVMRSTDAHDVAVGQVADRFNALVGPEVGRTFTRKWVGAFLRSRLRLATTKSRGVYVVPPEELPKLRALADRYGHAWEA